METFLNTLGNYYAILTHCSNIVRQLFAQVVIMTQNILTGYNGSLMLGRLTLYDKVFLPRAINHGQIWGKIHQTKCFLANRTEKYAKYTKFNSKYDSSFRRQNYASAIQNMLSTIMLLEKYIKQKWVRNSQTNF